ncbi:hypothetical protein [Pyrodictium abyssi]
MAPVGDPSIQPPRWLLPVIEYARRRLASLGYTFPGGLAAMFASIPAAHTTGYEPLYEYIVEAYYALREEAEEASPFAEPRFRPWLDALEEEVEALAALEESLAASSTVFYAEPILAAAVLGLGLNRARLGRWPRSGLRRTPGQQTIIVERGGARKLLVVPQSLYVLAAAGLHAAGIDPPGKGVAVLPDPAVIRKRVMELRLPLSQLAAELVEIINKHARRAASVGPSEACVSEGFLAVEYTVHGPGEIVVKYVC